MKVQEVSIRRILSTEGTKDKDHDEVFDICTDVLSTSGMLANHRVCTVTNGGMYD